MKSLVAYQFTDFHRT